MSIGFIEVFPPATADQIIGLEQHVGSPIPPAFRAFLGANNGGQPYPNYLRTNHDVSVHLFLGIGHKWEPYFDIYRYLRVYSDRVIPRFLPVATDEGGNLLYLSCNDSDYGHVYFWDHELEAEDDAPPTTENITFVAPDFRVFFDNLQPR
ncbi:SMI1/KNR4 family protein [Nocardiopsis gilva YIM 90087]|uniref:SMI1/KNR4 family protein n=1 Tax=Nocardiopsis gilva YIM 90087 TaxID=1235441 RepID=A0A223S296_9ACTN|nr:SMI1/KNR4 family protein [Nocardiopsis gilva]ASU82139.1 SMI1/KNR4 family protein [Nocardiopsis gilva YIM 90087]